MKRAETDALREDVTAKQKQWIESQAREKDTRAIIARDFSANLMNTTKWAEVALCLSELKISCSMRFVDVPDKDFKVGKFWHVTGDWFESVSLGTFTSISIERLDITTRTGRGLAAGASAMEIERRLSLQSIPCFRENESIRIVGHIRKPEQADGSV